MSSFATALALFVGFQILGLGLALRLRVLADLPPRFLGLLITASTALLSYGVFYVAVILPSMRSAAVVAVTLASVLATAAFLRTGAARAALLTPTAWLPQLLAGLLAAIYLWPVLAAGPAINDRLTWTLPSDNILPGLFAHRIMTTVGPERTAGLGPTGDHASERPPLQAAVVVTVGSMVRGSSHEYTILAALCQVQWLPALWLVGAACGLSRRTLAVVLVACAFSGFFFINTIYTWPKLFAAALMLGALAVALERPGTTPQAARVRAILVAALCALSLLAHPGSGFTLIAVPICWPFLRRIVTLRMTRGAAAGGVLIASLLFAPWLAYQSVVDPPTGRLVREHLGDGRPDGSATQAVLRANLERSFVEHVRVRAGNVAGQLGNPLVAVWPPSIADGQFEQFFHHGAALGWLLIGLAAILVTPRPGGADDAVRRLALLAVVALALWSVLVFAPGQAVIHHGSPVTTALLFFAGAYGLTRLPPPVGWTVLGLHVASSVYIWMLPVWRGPWGAG
ncbi:MAG: hypothetical protein ABIT71_16945 [Vicinamibacteraceae bacterium]